jgi:hypothetical protein
MYQSQRPQLFRFVRLVKHPDVWAERLAHTEEIDIHGMLAGFLGFEFDELYLHHSSTGIRSGQDQTSEPSQAWASILAMQASVSLRQYRVGQAGQSRVTYS